MRIAIVGQKDFGKAVLEAFAERGDTVAGIFCVPEKPGEAPDVLRIAAEARAIPTFAMASLRVIEARQTLRSLDVDLAVLAYVLQFVPQDFASIPRFGTIQFHPSLLPRYRGPSSINWPIIVGDSRTGLSIFRPTDGLDEGPILLQKETPIGPDDTVGKVYFGRLFPMGVAALLEAADLVVAGQAQSREQNHADATYEGWCQEAEAKINWHTHLDQTYNLIRGCDPAPGAWTLFGGRKLQVFDARKHPARSFAPVSGGIGSIVALGEHSIHIAAQGGQIEVFKLKAAGGKKAAAPQISAELGLKVGTVLGT